ncbi:MAG: ABC transporter ATP-binding protein [Candidatus Hydrogenedentes bacterium]|nr:ABC transporter ATP-binding protein [Candidatus Hydrogenedentota bacterium]MBI3118178.1 ABC transporter ATP-binding protein [Candidatus Hydrogenedentota bacterium]
MNSPPGDHPKGSAWSIYGRLLVHSWRYKGRLVLSLVLSLLIAAGFGTLLVSMGTVIDLTFYKPVIENGALKKEDPKDKIIRNIRESNAWTEEHLHWTAAPGLDTWFDDLVVDMRQEPLPWLKVLSALVVLLSLLINIARYFQEYLAGAVGANISTDLAEAMYENLMRQPVAFFERHTSGEILARFTNDIFMVNRGLAGVFVKLMREPFKAVAFVAFALSVDVWLTLVGFCVLPPVAYALVRIGQKMRRSVRRSLQKIASMASVVNETISGIMIVKGYNMEDYETGRVRTEITRLRRFLLQMVRLDAATGPVTEFLLLIGIVVFVLLSAQRVVSGQLDYGDIIMLFGALAMSLDPVRKLSSVNNMIQTSVASAERVFEFIDVKPTIVEAPDAIDIPPMKHTLSFENVHFSYNGKEQVLHGVNLEIRKGEMIALVGFSGAGKSTLAKLIPRFYEATKGVVKIDGQDIRRATFRSLRDQISIVTQDTILFAESIRSNIAFGRSQYSDERVREAARAANAAEFIERLPDGYDSPLGESGGTLSGGQRQRLAIARAIIKDPAILILDEATSSLDSESERLIQQALDEFIEGRTAVVIAHRLSTIQRADRIVVLDQGRVAEQGTHQELLRKNGIYRRLYDTQFGPQEQ